MELKHTTFELEIQRAYTLRHGVMGKFERLSKPIT